MRTHAPKRWLVALSMLLSACSAARVAPATPKPAPVATQSEARAGTRFHESIERLFASQGHAVSPEERGVLELPAEGCKEAVRWAPDMPMDCTAILLGRGATLLILQQARCEEARCIERSWVFLRPYRTGLPLPTRRRSDYQALRAELSKEEASSLWLAGFRGSSDTRTADLDEEFPSLADYSSCALTPEGGNLVCRTLNGGAVHLDPVTAQLRVVARVDLGTGRLADDGFASPVRFTQDGQLALPLVLSRHPLCERGPCEAVGFVAWPSVAPQLAHLVREDAQPY